MRDIRPRSFVCFAICVSRLLSHWVACSLMRPQPPPAVLIPAGHGRSTLAPMLPVTPTLPIRRRVPRRIGSPDFRRPPAPYLRFTDSILSRASCRCRSTALTACWTSSSTSTSLPIPARTTPSSPVLTMARSPLTLSSPPDRPSPRRTQCTPALRRTLLSPIACTTPRIPRIRWGAR